MLNDSLRAELRSPVGLEFSSLLRIEGSTNFIVTVC